MEVLILSIVNIKLITFKFDTENVKDFNILLESALYFSQHINYKPSQVSELLGLIRFLTNNSSLDILKYLYDSLIKSKLQCTSAAWNNITFEESNKLKIILSRFMCDCRRGLD
jgi:hypothetical protein